MAGRRRYGAVLALGLLVPGIVGTPASARPPLPAPILIDAQLERTTAAGAQAIRVTGGGCVPEERPVELDLYAGTAPDAIEGHPVAASLGEIAPDGTFDAALALVANTDAPVLAALAEGTYTFVAWCYADGDFAQSETAVVTVAGTRPFDAVAIEPDADGSGFDLGGEGCDQGEVTVRVFTYGDENPGDEYDATWTVPADASGSWAFRWEATVGAGFIDAEAACGEPTADGFLYAPQRTLFQTPPPTVPTTVPVTTSTTAVDPGPPPAPPSARPIAGAATYAG